MENHVTNLALSKKLKELGVKQESEFYWLLNPTPSKDFWLGDKDMFEERKPYLQDFYPAFLASELGEILPEKIPKKSGQGYDILQIWAKFNIEYHTTFEPPNVRIMNNGESEADIRAKMLIHLIESKLITL